jgi:hypothetical protein
MDVGEGQKQTRCIDSPVRRRGGVKCSENGVVVCLAKSTPPLLLHIHRNKRIVPTHHCTALQMPKVGVPASPWMWAKARSKLGALFRLCGDGVVSNVARMGSLFAWQNPTHPSFCTYIETNGPFRPTTALHCRCPKLAFPPRHGCGRRPEAN